MAKDGCLGPPRHCHGYRGRCPRSQPSACPRPSKRSKTPRSSHKPVRPLRARLPAREPYPRVKDQSLDCLHPELLTRLIVRSVFPTRY